MPKKKNTALKQFKIPLLSMEDYAEILDTDLFKLLGLEKLPTKEKTQMAQSLGNIIMDRVLIRIDSKLQAPDVAELKSILDTEDKGNFYRFLQERNIDLPEIITQEAMNLKAQLVSFVLIKNKA
jgi:succinate dehydrogenase flavin-adding protein (antitoxin of CptAB toxin-antitoxin module)